VKRTLIFLLSLMPVLAFGANTWNERDLAWTAPTTCSDGTAITNCPVTGYKLEAAGTCTATSWNAVATVGKVLTYHVTNLAPGNYCFRVKATSAGGDSAPSPTTASSQTTVVQPPPSVPDAPGSVVVAISPTAYTVIKSQDALVMLPVGTVATSTACDVTQAISLKGQTYNPVPVSSVKFTGTARPIVTFAICG
jgi:hypothetical protein